MSALVPRPGIMKIAPYVGGDSKIPGVAEPIKLASNEAALGPSPKAMKVYADLAQTIFRYPDGGAVDIRKALGEYHGLDPARIVCGSGSDELLSLIARAYAGPGDEVLFSEYGFAMYPITTLGVGATPVVAKEKNLRTDVDAMLKLASPRTKLVFLANPNNPTGSYIPPEEVERLLKGLPDHALLVLDAAYAEYVTRND